MNEPNNDNEIEFDDEMGNVEFEMLVSLISVELDNPVKWENDQILSLKRIRNWAIRLLREMDPDDKEPDAID